MPGPNLKHGWSYGAITGAASSLILLGACVAHPERVGSPAALDADPLHKPKPATATRLVLLGTGTPNADPDRSGPASAIIAGGHAYLVDCGTGVVRRAAAAHLRGIEVLDPPRLGHVFITHLHSDHTLGLPDLIFTPWVLERTEPLEVFGPPGTKDMVAHILRAYADDIRVRTDGTQPIHPTAWQANPHDIAPGVVFQDANVTVKAFPVRHGTWPHAFGYRFETADRVIVFSGDTAPSESLIEAARGCDVLVHEVYSQTGFSTRPPQWQRYHAAFHTSSVELAKIAQRVGPRLLVLYHQLFWGVSEDDLLAEVRRHYDGQVVSADDLDVY